MRGAGIFEGVQCCRVDLSSLFADDNQSDWRPEIFRNYVRTRPNSWAKQVREIEWGYLTLDSMIF